MLDNGCGMCFTIYMTHLNELTTEAFLALRSEWKDAGCPADHPYLALEVGTPEPIEGLVTFSDGTRYGGRSK
jgi:hypothetical protein